MKFCVIAGVLTLFAIDVCSSTYTYCQSNQHYKGLMDHLKNNPCASYPEVSHRLYAVMDSDENCANYAVSVLNSVAQSQIITKQETDCQCTGEPSLVKGHADIQGLFIGEQRTKMECMIEAPYRMLTGQAGDPKCVTHHRFWGLLQYIDTVKFGFTSWESCRHHSIALLAATYTDDCKCSEKAVTIQTSSQCLGYDQLAGELAVKISSCATINEVWQHLHQHVEAHCRVQVLDMVSMLVGQTQPVCQCQDSNITIKKRMFFPHFFGRDRNHKTTTTTTTTTTTRAPTTTTAPQAYTKSSSCFSNAVLIDLVNKVSQSPCTAFSKLMPQLFTIQPRSCINEALHQIGILTKSATRTCSCQDVTVTTPKLTPTMSSSTPPPTTTSTKPPKPFTATSPSGICHVCVGADCNRTLSMSCPTERPYCLTHVRVTSSGEQQVYRGCESINECRNDWAGRSQSDSSCLNLDTDQSQYPVECHFCCVTPDCNAGPQFVPAPSTWYRP